MEELDEGTRKLKDLPHSWTAEINHGKIFILPQTSHVFNVIIIKIQEHFFTDIKNNNNLNHYME